MISAFTADPNRLKAKQFVDSDSGLQAEKPGDVEQESRTEYSFVV
jgi:hypothetical protein